MYIYFSEQSVLPLFFFEWGTSFQMFTKKLFKFLKKNIHIEADGFVVFYIQKCLFVSFLRLHSPLCALKI